MKSAETACFALCFNNDGYPASLEVGKMYRVIPDEEASTEGYLRLLMNLAKTMPLLQIGFI
jgi:hypothetical protein